MLHDFSQSCFSEMSYKLLVDSVPDYTIYMLHPDGRVGSWNVGAERSKGYTADEIIGRHFSVFYSEMDDAAGMPQVGLDIALREGRFETRGWRVRKNGSRFWAHVVIDPVRNDSGRLIGFAKITRDCSEQQRMEEEVRASEHRFRLLVEGISDYAIYMLDLEGRIVNWNLGAQRAKGYCADEIVGQHFSIFYTEEDLAAGLPGSSLATVLRDGKFEAEGWRVRKDGSRFWAHVVIDPIYQENGALIGFAKITRDRTEQKAAAARMHHMARHDGLTGMPNRTQFLEKIDAALETADRTGQRVAAMVIDLDRFKEVNDTLGHAAGDTVLRTLADRMTPLIGEGEFVGRVGGDEFIAFKIFHDDADMQGFARRLHEVLTVTISLGHTDIVPGASIGVAVYPTNAPERDKLISNADLAMYRAKESIDDKICFYQATMDDASRSRRTMARDIWTALDEKQFFLNYQTQRSVRTGEITGYEVLLRWQHPVHGLVPPGVFIPIAEECGAISAIGDWVLETACREAVEWPLAHKIAINLSPLQLGNLALVHKVRSVLASTGLPASQLELEVTESAIVTDKTRALHVLRQIKAMGVTIAIDDFGTGYSSLETLRSFPFDKIKLDRSFISELETSAQSKAFVRAILALGQSLNVPVLAEGVETREQMAVLEGEGCHEVQGFLFGYPETLREMSLGAERQGGSLKNIA